MFAGLHLALITLRLLVHPRTAAHSLSVFWHTHRPATFSLWLSPSLSLSLSLSLVLYTLQPKRWTATSNLKSNKLYQSKFVRSSPSSLPGVNADQSLSPPPPPLLGIRVASLASITISLLASPAGLERVHRT